MPKTDLVSCAPEQSCKCCGATAAFHMLNLWWRISAYDRACRTYEEGWATNLQKPILRMSEATLGVLGVGRMGAAFIKLMKPFGFRILGFDPHQPPGHEDSVGYERVETLEAFLAASDAISLHCVLTPETTGLVDDGFIAAMKPGALLVNTARGGLFKDLDVVEQGLKSGQLGGLGTDVLPSELPVDHPLISAWREDAPWLQGRLIITPHTAHYSEKALYDMRYMAAETAALFLNQNEFRNRIV